MMAKAVERGVNHQSSEVMDKRWTRINRDTAAGHLSKWVQITLTNTTADIGVLLVKTVDLLQSPHTLIQGIRIKAEGAVVRIPNHMCPETDGHGRNQHSHLDHINLIQLIGVVRIGPLQSQGQDLTLLNTTRGIEQHGVLSGSILLRPLLHLHHIIETGVHLVTNTGKKF